jgi:hypothetical protein
MRLLKIKLKDFRRFAVEQSLDLNEDVIALVGPNESGKSSLLSALELVGSLTPPTAADTTRDLPGPATVSALFVLEADDRELLTEIHDGDKVTHLWIDLIAGREQSVWRPDPQPSRDLAPRQRCQGLVEELQGDPGLEQTYSTSEEWPWDPQLLVEVKKILSLRRETLPQEWISSLEALAHRLQAIRYPVSEDTDENPLKQLSARDRDLATAREAAATALIELAAIEQEPRPVLKVLDALKGRTPDFAFFRQPDRELRSTYNLAEVATDTPPALANLCALAELNLASVENDFAAGRSPHIEAVFEAANERLRERFRETWRQSDVFPRLGTPLDGVIRVMVAVEGGNEYSFPEEHSDGLRWFMALQAFLAARGKEKPVLLVDEAETHLHYDAQADLIDALMNQRIAQKVIYTTHSIGCLPPDLGCGIRVMLAEQDAERSRIANSYWSVDPGEDQKVGYVPVLFAMGARLLSLTIPRYGVIAEGPSDAILLPSLFRDATGLQTLPYRIVPGLSDVTDSDVPSLSRHAGKVISLTDGDLGGLELRKRLLSGGIATNEIFHLGQVRSNCTLEDIVEPGVLAEAINRELDTWNIGPLRVVPTELPPTGRWNWLVSQGVATGTPVERLSKQRVAQRVVDIGREASASGTSRALLDATDVARMKELHEAMCLALGL